MADQRRRWTAPFRLRNYRAVVGMVATFPHPVDALRRYIGADAPYPWRTTLRTPLGRVEVLIPHSHDVRTVNEIFCRKDYGTTTPRVVVDVGANIGIAALYYLTRRPDSIVHCWEPDPRNLAVLRINVSPFADRCRIHDRALAPTAGPAAFVTEPIGRYGGLADFTSLRGYGRIIVECDDVNDALREVLAEGGRIDLLKIDTEGSEPALVAALAPDVRPSIGDLVFEMPGGVVRSRTCGSAGTILGSPSRQGLLD